MVSTHCLNISCDCNANDTLSSMEWANLLKSVIQSFERQLLNSVSQESKLGFGTCAKEMSVNLLLLGDEQSAV